MPIVDCGRCGARNRVDEGEAASKQAVCGNCGAELEAGAAGGAGGANPAGAQGKPVAVTDASFEREVLGVRGRPVLVDFWAEWCGPCRALGPALDQLASEAGGRYTITKLNVDENPVTASQFGIRSIPAMFIFKDGQLVDRLIGLQPKQAIAARLAQHS
jgi:thioredoxin 1